MSEAAVAAGRAFARSRYGPALIGLGSFVAFIVLVELLIRVGLINRFIVPMPSDIIAAFPRVIEEEQVLHRFVLTATEALSRTGHFLGLGLASVANLLDPEVFVIGGGVSAAGDLILETARRTMEATVLHPAGEAPRVKGAALGNAAGWIGAALTAAGRREM